MVAKIEMDKGNSLGYGDMEGDLLGRRFGYHIMNEQEIAHIVRYGFMTCLSPKGFVLLMV